LEENLLTLGEESRVLNPITSQSCSDFCSEKQYTFFILKYEYASVLLFYKLIYCLKIFSKNTNYIDLKHKFIVYLFNFFSTCYCSKNYISRLMRQLDFECSKKCSGDNSTSCGGAPNLVSSYITDSSST